jgi:voltage-gated potassium channel
MQRFLKRAMLRSVTKEFFYVNSFLTLVTIISIFSIALQTVEGLAKYSLVFERIEYFVVCIFTLEYVARLYVKEDRVKYVFSFFGTIDLIAIVPSYFGLLNLTFLKAARIARILEFLRSVRLAKLARINKYSNQNSKKVQEVQLISVRIYALVLIAAIFIFGSLLYFIEGDNEYFKDIPSGMLWVTQLLFGGNSFAGSVSYTTSLLIILVQFLGLLLFGVLIHIIGRSFEKKLLGSTNTAK